MVARKSFMYPTSCGHGQRTGALSLRLRTIALVGCLATIASATAHAQPSMFIADGQVLIQPDDIVALGATVEGESNGRAFVVRNFGDEALVLDAAVVDGDFGFLFEATVSSNPIAPGGFGIMTVVFTAEGGAQFGGRGARITIQNNDPDHVDGYVFFVTAVITAPPLPVMQVVFDETVVGNNGLINLGDVDVGQAVEFDVLVESIGSGPVTVTDVRFDDIADDAESAAFEFERVAGFNQTIEPQDFATYTLRVSPTAGGIRRAALVIDNDSLQDPYVITVVVNAIAEAELPPPPIDVDEPTPEPGDEGDPNEQPAPEDEGGPDDQLPPDEMIPPMPMPCGAGMVGLVPMMFAGLCSAKIGAAGTRRHRRHA